MMVLIKQVNTDKVKCKDANMAECELQVELDVIRFYVINA